MTEPIRLSILIPFSIDPFDRQWFEEQIEEAFAPENLGEVLGGGTALDGSGSDIALDVNDRERGLAVVLGVLRREYAPPGTQIVEHGDTRVVHDVYDATRPYVPPPVVETEPEPERGPRAADLPQLGDTYLVPLGENFFGACRVIAIRNDHYASYVAGTEWFGAAPPDMADPRLRALVVFRWLGTVGPTCKYWLVGKPPEEFRRLGTILPTPEEAQLPGGQHTHYWSMIPDALRMHLEELAEAES